MFSKNNKSFQIFYEQTSPIKLADDVFEFIVKNFKIWDNETSNLLNKLSNLSKYNTKNPKVQIANQNEILNTLSLLIRKDKQIGDYLLSQIVKNFDTPTKNFISKFKTEIKNFIEKGGTYESTVKNIDKILNSSQNGVPVFQTPIIEIKDYVKKDLENYAKEISNLQNKTSKSNIQANQQKDALIPIRGIKNKEMFGSGIEHQIFASKSNPNVLFKVGHQDVVDEWLDVFKSNPEIFPKIYRNGKLKDGNYYVEIEKLNTSKFEDNWDDMELALEDVGALDVDRGESFTDLYTKEGANAKIFSEIGKKLQKHDKVAYNFFIEFLKVIKKCEKAILSVKKKDTLVDAHKYNFGYGSDGKIKCLDL